MREESAVTPSGTTAAARPELAGEVVSDELRTHPVHDPSGNEVARVELQDRVVRSRAAGTLDFYLRVTAIASSVSGFFVSAVWREAFAGNEQDVDFRVDGLGKRGPSEIRYTGPTVVFTWMGPGGPDPEHSLTSAALSRFVFIKTPATRFDAGGLLTASGGSFTPPPGFDLALNHTTAFQPVY